MENSGLRRRGRHLIRQFRSYPAVLSSVRGIWQRSKLQLDASLIEYRTRPLSRELMLAEVAELCAKLAACGIDRVAVSFGWDSNLDIEEMWHDVEVPLADLGDYLADAERAGTIEVGKADVFVKGGEVEFTLCHESDLHITGNSPLVVETQSRWSNMGYEPYPVEPRV